ncbi:fructokinase [Tistlia consotensis]|uniref:Fructokinase n=1 Tax=Tistlia consotensis USBA 355 TaxID=560819 RepID=A0A1Y6BUL6_9PROT|nr:carbohydrate kinase [Tistlia consotensis]SMF29547.1 fructokinase [Tistlia consotensis USBA 355]SNR91189.1 fructokinase [Tistlia consotensis]
MFLVCGEALWDLFAVEAEHSLRFDARIGGSPFNVAVGLARLGQPAALFTGISTDRLGTRLVEALDREGVATDLLVRSARPSTLSLVDLGADGVPVYAFYGEGAADRSVRPDQLPALGPEVWGLHAGSYSLAVEPVGSSLLALIEREAGRRLVSLDPNVRLTVEPDTGLWRDRVDRFLRLSDLVKVSDEDLALLYPGTGAAEIAGHWLSAGAGLVVVTRGAEGAEAFSAAGRVAMPGRPVAVVDTVGAGDTFQAALIAGLAEAGVRRRAALDALDREQVGRLLDFAVGAAAITCTRRGADLPRRAELPSLAEEIT